MAKKVVVDISGRREMLHATLEINKNRDQYLRELYRDVQRSSETRRAYMPLLKKPN